MEIIKKRKDEYCAIYHCKYRNGKQGYGMQGVAELKIKKCIVT